MRYHVNGQQHEKPSHRTNREPRLGYARVAREVLGGGLTIDTLPDNMTHLVEDAGFIFMGEVTHRMLTATQYIAPVMANFDPNFSKESTVQYLDNGEVFVMQWEQVRLYGREAEGAYTFQAALHLTGTITFSYRDIPLPVEVISSAEHHVKTGLSDAFMVYLPSPQSSACLQHDSCELCLSSNLTSGCTWCNVLQRGAGEEYGMDRHRQEWLDYACSEEAEDVTCEDYSRGGPDSSIDPSVPSDSEVPTPLGLLLEGPATENVKTGPLRQHDGSAHTGVIAGVVAALVLLLAVTLLALYINSHPSTSYSYWPSMKFRKQGFHSSYAEMEVEGHEKEGIMEAGQC
ncbi:unnamed protein product [Coregonus sp. 'balchen']|nr:unnamed protein product [Coregonus sp. 'balchen']